MSFAYKQNKTIKEGNLCEVTVADTSGALKSDSTEVTQTPAAVVESTAEVTCEEGETSLPAEVDPSKIPKSQRQMRLAVRTRKQQRLPRSKQKLRLRLSLQI